MQTQVRPAHANSLPESSPSLVAGQNLATGQGDGVKTQNIRAVLIAIAGDANLVAGFYDFT